MGHVLLDECVKPGCIMGRRQASRGSEVLWSVFCWVTLGPTIYVAVTLTSSSCLNISTDYVHPFMETVFLALLSSLATIILLILYLQSFYMYFLCFETPFSIIVVLSPAACDFSSHFLYCLVDVFLG